MDILTIHLEDQRCFVAGTRASVDYRCMQANLIIGVGALWLHEQSPNCRAGHVPGWVLLVDRLDMRRIGLRARVRLRIDGSLSLPAATANCRH